MKKITVTDENYSESIRLLTVTNDSYTDLRPSQAGLWEQGCQYREEDYKNKILS